MSEIVKSGRRGPSTQTKKTASRAVFSAFQPAYASRWPSFLDRRYDTKPTPRKPRIIIAQVEGSGAAGAAAAEKSTETPSSAGPKAARLPLGPDPGAGVVLAKLSVSEPVP